LVLLLQLIVNPPPGIVPFPKHLDRPDDLRNLGEKSGLPEAAIIDGDDRYRPDLAFLFPAADQFRQVVHILLREDGKKIRKAEYFPVGSRLFSIDVRQEIDDALGSHVALAHRNHEAERV
jgi:hypothetical protein